MNITLKVWRQAQGSKQGAFETHQVQANEHMSFLEMLDVVNAGLVEAGNDPIAFEHDCREGICGACGAMVNGRAHGPTDRSTLCQVHMRAFSDGDTIVVEPWRAEAFPVLKDLVVDRSAFDRVIQSGGFVSVNTGNAPDANTIPIGKEVSDDAFEAAACIGCGACVSACPNASASLFVSAKISQLSLLPQGQPERYARASSMVQTMDDEGFGNCTNHGECAAVCPKGVSLRHIARMNRDLLWARLTGK